MIDRTERTVLGVAAMVSMVLIAVLAAASLVLVSALSDLVVPAAYAQSPAAVRLEAAVAREQTDGDLNAAVSAYQKISGDPAAPREVRAKALLRLAGCYEKLGKQAQGLYQQIVREFADQPAAKQAQVRLAILRQSDQRSAPSVIMQRKIEISGGSFGPQATDGRRMVYRDDATGDLLYRDTATKTRMTIFRAKPDDFPAWMPSRDFSMVALQFDKKPNRPAFIALIQIDGKGYRELVRDDEQSTVLGADGGILNWSWDGKFLLMASQEAGKRPSLLVVNTGDGERRELRTQETGHFEWCAFSPDGRFVACSVYPDFGTPGRAQILVWPVQGGERRLIQEEAPRSSWEAGLRSLRLLDWTADGRFLAISSTQSGKSALHLFPIRDGQAAGPPLLVRSGRYESGVTTKAGKLVYQMAKPGGFHTVHVASLDAQGRPGTWQKLERTGARPSWSPDSRRIVYSTLDDESELGATTVRVHNVASGEDREIYRGRGFIFCAWAVQQPAIFCSQSAEATDILSITPDSGQTERLGSFPMSVVSLGRPSRDNKALYLSKMVNGNDVAFRWEIATGQETVLDQSAGSTECCSVSPDERWLWRANARHAEVRPMPGGEWKILRNSYHQTTLTADGQWFFYHGRDSSGNQSVLRVPASRPDGPPERLGPYPVPALHGRIEISPDGRQVVAASYDYDHGFELWALENFFPPAPKR